MPAKFCSKCGAQLKQNAKFCSKCGAVVKSDNVQAVQPPQQTQQLPSANAQFVQPAAPQTPQLQNTAQELGAMVNAPAQLGGFELDCGGMQHEMNTLLSPAKALLSGFTNIFSGLKNIHKNPKAIVFALILAALWIVFMIWNQSGKANGFSKVMSMLTFAEGGAFGSVANKIGGVFGKGIVVSALMGLVSGGLRNLPTSFKTMFSKGLDIGLLIFGAGFSVTVYQLCAGYAGTYGVMVAVSGAGIGLNALGGTGGYLQTLAVSFTSRKLGGIRIANGVKSKSLLTGVTLGSVLAASLSALSYPFWIPLIVAAVGLILALAIPSKQGGAAV